MIGVAEHTGHPLQRVGYLTSHYPAPSHTFIRREIEALRKLGMHVASYSVRPALFDGDSAVERAAGSETFTILEVPKARIIAIGARAVVLHPLRTIATLRLALRHRVPGLRATIWAFLHLLEALVLADRLERDGIGHLHNHFGNAGAIVGMLAADFAGIPWSLTLHGISEFDYPAGNLLPQKLERAEFAACVSYFGMAQAMRLASEDLWHKLAIVRCALDPEALPAVPPRRAAGDGTDSCQIICVGRLSPEKGHFGLLDAFAAIASGERRVHLTLVGEGPSQAALERRVTELGLEEHVRFAGRLGEASTLAAIAASDMLVLPSFMEGLPVVLMEAMALGVPVVSSRVAGIPELVEHRESGLLFDPANWTALAAAMAELVDNPELGQRFARAGKAMVSAHFFHPAAAEPMAALLRTSLARHAPRRETMR